MNYELNNVEMETVEVVETVETKTEKVSKTVKHTKEESLQEKLILAEEKRDADIQAVKEDCKSKEQAIRERFLKEKDNIMKMLDAEKERTDKKVSIEIRKAVEKGASAEEIQAIVLKYLPTN